MNIAMVTPLFTPIGGLETHVRGLSSYLVARGHTVTLVTTDAADREPLRRVPKAGVSAASYTLRFSCYGFIYTYFAVSPALYAFLLTRVGDFDIVHAHGFGHTTSDFACLAAKLRGTRFVLTTHGIHQDVLLQFPKSALWNAYRDFVVKRTVSQSDAVIALTPSELPYLTRLGVRRSRIHVIPNVVTVPEHLKGATKGGSSRDEITAVYLGRIDPSKGLEYLIEAVSRIQKVHLILAGPQTPHSRVVAQHIRKKGLSAKVELRGILHECDKANLLATCDIFCMPSKYEGFSIATAEAMAYGKACIATRVGGLTQLVRDGVNGLLVNYGDVEALQEAIEKLCNDPRLRQILGQQARRSVDSFKAEVVYPMIEGVYFDIATGQ